MNWQRTPLAVLSTFAAMLAALSGCTPQIYSPPASPVLLESSATVGKARTAAFANAGGHGALFGPEVVAGQGGLRVGVGDDVGLSATGSTLVALGGESGDPHPGAYALRLGAKYTPIEHLAVVGGVGGGRSAAGGFASPDVGVIGSYENPYVVPFVGMRALLSQPIRAVTIAIQDGDEQARLTPRTTLGGQFSFGARVPLGPRGSAPAQRGSLLCAGTLTMLADSRQHDTFTGLQCGAELKWGGSEQ